MGEGGGGVIQTVESKTSVSFFISNMIITTSFLGVGGRGVSLLDQKPSIRYGQSVGSKT